jgi:hypothetical protein
MQELFIPQAIASITHSASGAAVIFNINNGFNEATSVHPAVGLYDLDLDTPLAATDGLCFATPRSTNADTNIAVSHTSATRKRVTVSIAGTASDTPDFDIIVYRRPSS